MPVSALRFLRPLVTAITLVLTLSGCGEPDLPSPPSEPVRGALLDGSEDAPPPAQAESAAAAPAELPTSGVARITFRDLSLEGLDVDALLDAVLFPEEYTPEELEGFTLPERITRFDGRDVSLVGYVIPGELEGNRMRDFMLVRDLASCCFGGSPGPDEWVDVVMEEGKTAEYHPFLPTRVTGRMTLGGEVDDAGFAIGIFHLAAREAELER